MPLSQQPTPKKKKVPGRPFQKGQVANPNGGRAHSQELKRVRALSKKELAEVGNLILRCNADEIEALTEDPTTSVLQLMVASIAGRIIRKGDMAALDTLLNRLVGRVKEEVTLVGESQVAVRVTLPSNGREVKKVGAA